MLEALVCVQAPSTLHFRKSAALSGTIAGYASFSRYKGHWHRSASEDTIMRKLLSGICATALAAAFAVSSVVPVNAAPIFVPRAQAVQPQADVIQIQTRTDSIIESGCGGATLRNWSGNNFGNYRNFRRGGNYAASVVAATTGGTTAIEATGINGGATAITTVFGSRRAPLSPARLSAARSPTATTTIIPGTPAAALTNVGATVVIAPTALGTTRSSPITDRAGRVIRPTADSGPECLPKKPAPRWRGLFARRER